MRRLNDVGPGDRGSGVRRPAEDAEARRGPLPPDVQAPAGGGGGRPARFGGVIEEIGSWQGARSLAAKQPFSRQGRHDRIGAHAPLRRDAGRRCFRRTCAKSRRRQSERPRYTGLFAGASRRDGRDPIAGAAGAKVDARDGHGRTPFHVAAFARRHDAMRAWSPRRRTRTRLENDRYTRSRSPRSPTTSRR
jgi:hypothetical protein